MPSRWFRLKVVEGAIGPEEGLLDEVAGVVDTAREALGRAMERARMRHRELLERGSAVATRGRGAKDGGTTRDRS
jgi:hypothetical protein